MRRRLPALLPVLAACVLTACLLAAPAGASAPGSARVVVGSGGWLFIAQDWTVACQDAGRARPVATAVRDLAAALAAGGRRTVVTVGPDKSTPLAARVPAGVTKKACGDASRAALWRELGSTAGPAFLDLRPSLRLATAQAQTYWRNDTHWTPTAGAVYARELARRLDPALVPRLQATTRTYTRSGDLARVLGRPAAESVVALQVVNPGVRVRELPQEDIGLAVPARHTTAVLQPGARVVPGRTVFVGDSFDDTALEQLAPLFADAVFFWPGDDPADVPTVVRLLRDADTVVLETVERFAQRSTVLTQAAVGEARRLPPR